MFSTVSSSHHVQSYHRHDHLLFQFILLELILAQQELTRINKLAHKLKKEFSPDIFENLLTEIIKLSGASRGYMRIFIGNELGILTKLKNICAYFSQSHTSTDLETEMYDAANRAWLASLQALDVMIKHAQNDSEKKRKMILTSLLNCLENINHQIGIVADFSRKVVLRFHGDENVIFFLLTYQHSLDAVYGKEFVLKSLRKMFPKKDLEVVEEFLIFKYTERGFKHLIPIIHEKILALGSNQQ